MKTIVDYVGEFITKLPDTSSACTEFGAKLVCDPNREQDFDVNVWLYRYPFSEENQAADIMGELSDVMTTNKFGLCVRPLAGGVPDPYSEKSWPMFSIQCRHQYPGCAFNTMMALMMELNNNARVFPQNGTIRLLHSQPVMLMASAQFAYCTQAIFRVLSATNIL